MFWREEELRELKGTEVLPRIGKAKSEEQYNQLLFPIITAHPNLFDLSQCGMDAFHRMGSLVLAYSFGSTASQDNEDEEEEEEVKSDLAIVPLADLLNANPKLNNVIGILSLLTLGTFI